MKLLFGIKRLENMAGGAERVILQITGELASRGYDVTLLSFDRKGAKSFYPLSQSVHWVQLGVGDSAKRAGFMETMKRIFSLRKVVKAIDADIVIPFQHSFFVPMVIAMTGMKAPIIASEHIVPDHYRNRPLEYALLTVTGLVCKKITVLSDAIIAMYPKCLQSRMVAMPNPVEQAKKRADVIGGERRTLLSVGRLDPQKDQKTLIEAFAKIANQCPDWDLKIIGEGKLRPDLESQIVSLNLSDRISLPGVTQDIMGEYASAQCFVLASLYEAFGLATAEAMSAGLPVIGFADCAGTNELIQDEMNGLLVKIKNDEGRADALAECLVGILGNPDLRYNLGQAGQSYIQSFSTQKIVDKWENDLLKKV
jgi:glycosyltransferase involved in cell wall biosynthesis